MKFNDKYPDAKKPKALLGPHADLYVEPNLAQTWRMYPCSICRQNTGWVDLSLDAAVHVCSEECQSQVLATAKEIAYIEAVASAADVGERLPAAPPEPIGDDPDYFAEHVMISVEEVPGGESAVNGL